MSKKIDLYTMNGHNKEFYTLEVSVKCTKINEDFNHKILVLEKRELGLDIDDLPCSSSINIDFQDVQNLIDMLILIQKKHDNSHD
jgi:uncharacterized membrane protein